jgi:hypothetical protein
MMKMLSRSLAVLVAFTTACGPFRANAGDNPAFIIFHNNGMDQAAVYLVSAASDFRRIGTVPAGRTETLKISSDMTHGPVNIVVRMLANYDLPSTGQVTLRPGESYEVTLPMDAKMLIFLPARQ